MLKPVIQPTDFGLPRPTAACSSLLLPGVEVETRQDVAGSAVLLCIGHNEHVGLQLQVGRHGAHHLAQARPPELLKLRRGERVREASVLVVETVSSLQSVELI